MMRLSTFSGCLAALALAPFSAFAGTVTAGQLWSDIEQRLEGSCGAEYAAVLATPPVSGKEHWVMMRSSVLDEPDAAETLPMDYSPAYAALVASVVGYQSAMEAISRLEGRAKDADAAGLAVQWDVFEARAALVDCLALDEAEILAGGGGNPVVLTEYNTSISCTAQRIAMLRALRAADYAPEQMASGIREIWSDRSAACDRG